MTYLSWYLPVWGVSLLVSTCMRCISSGIYLYEVYLFWYQPECVYPFWYLPEWGVSLLISTGVWCMSPVIYLRVVYLPWYLYLSVVNLSWYLPVWGVSLLVSTWMCVSLLVSTWVGCIPSDVYLLESCVSLLVSTWVRCISSDIYLSVVYLPKYLSVVYLSWYLLSISLACSSKRVLSSSICSVCFSLVSLLTKHFRQRLKLNAV